MMKKHVRVDMPVIESFGTAGRARALHVLTTAGFDKDEAADL